MFILKFGEIFPTAFNCKKSESTKHHIINLFRFNSTYKYLPVMLAPHFSFPIRAARKKVPKQAY